MASNIEWLTVEQIANELGVHPETIREYIRDGLLPAVQLKRTYRIKREDYEKFIHSRYTGKQGDQHKE